MKLTPNMLRYLQDKKEGCDPFAHCADFTDRAGVTRTERALVKHGLLLNGRLTRAGREAGK